jgi:hypothetical protein
MDKAYGHDEEKTVLIKLEFFMDPDNPDSGSKSPPPEEWIKILLVDVLP